MGHCDTMTERPRITIDVRKLGDTGVGRSASALVSGLATAPGDNRIRNHQAQQGLRSMNQKRAKTMTRPGIE